MPSRCKYTQAMRILSLLALCLLLSGPLLAQPNSLKDNPLRVEVQEPEGSIAGCIDVEGTTAPNATVTIKITGDQNVLETQQPVNVTCQADDQGKFRFPLDSWNFPHDRPILCQIQAQDA